MLTGSKRASAPVTPPAGLESQRVLRKLVSHLFQGGIAHADIRPRGLAYGTKEAGQRTLPNQIHWNKSEARVRVCGIISGRYNIDALSLLLITIDEL